MGWFLRLEHQGATSTRPCASRFEQPEYYVNEKVRGEVFRQFGYFMTESTGHLSEYLPYFRKNQKALDLLLRRAGLRRRDRRVLQLVASRGRRSTTAGESSWKAAPTCPPAASSTARTSSRPSRPARPSSFNGNVINGGMITNLPADCCVEGPIYVDRTGLHKTIVGDLPSQCAALNLTNINVQRLAVEAALAGDPEDDRARLRAGPAHLGGADPARRSATWPARCSKPQRQWLPQFDGKTIRPTPTISIPEDVVPAEVPIDPALSIIARFGDVLSPKGG